MDQTSWLQDRRALTVYGSGCWIAFALGNRGGPGCASEHGIHLAKLEFVVAPEELWRAFWEPWRPEGPSRQREDGMSLKKNSDPVGSGRGRP
jgi:hypothetical protein